MGNSTVIELKILNMLCAERVNQNDGSKRKRKADIIYRLRDMRQKLERHTSKRNVYFQMCDKGVKI